MASEIRQQGYFSLLRWRADINRDESRNVAVVLVEKDGQFGGLKAAPLSTISPRLHEQGLLDTMLRALEKRFQEEVKPDLTVLTDMRESLHQSLYFTEPEPVAVPDVDLVLNSLYKAYVSPRAGGSGGLTKGRIMDQVIQTIRNYGLDARRNSYLNDYLFDITIELPSRVPIVAQVISFSTTKQNWSPEEYAAGHYLYALERVEASGAAIIQPPREVSHHNAFKSYERVSRWFELAQVPSIRPEELKRAEDISILMR